MDPKDIKALRFRPSLRMRRIHMALVAFSLFALLALIYTGYWFTLAIGARTKTLEWTAERRAGGFEARVSQLQVSGFPFEIRLRSGAVRLGDPGAVTPWSWTADGAAAVVKPWAPFHVAVFPSGVQKVTLIRGGRAQTFRGRAKHIEVAFTIGGGGDDMVTVEGLSISGGGGTFRLDSGRLRARFPKSVGGNDETPVFALDFDVRGLGFAAASGLPFGGAIDHIGFSGQVLGPLDPARGFPSKKALASWRDGGGTVTVSRLEAVWGPLGLRASGTMALDKAMQPIGAFTAKFKGFIAGVEALRKRGLIRSRDAVTATLVLGALSQKDSNGGTSLNLSVTVQNRKLFAGPLPLMAIPEIHWN
ncbi:MAG TPA: DUF2125 domain-containing protein [Alphaproteobacteria bacterium]|nr:DUF2125 domain-containing protein [Alphaproteobacteria bacterium]